MHQKYKKIKRLLPKRLYHFIDIVARYRPISMSTLRKKFKVQQVSDGQLLQQAKQLHAEVYLRRGFVSESDIRDGILHSEADPHQHHATYFVVTEKATGEAVFMARQLHHRPDLTLPIFRHLELSKDYGDVAHQEIVEISAFAKRHKTDSRAAYLLFYEMLRHSSQQGHHYWLLACDVNVYKRLKVLFGPVLRQVGPKAFYMGSMVVPAEINLHRAPHMLRRGHLLSLPPLRGVRKFLHSSFATVAPRQHHAFFWNQYAKSYDGLLHFYPYRHLVDHVADMVVALKPKRVLDLGCGTGNVTTRIIEKDPRVHIDAVDWSSTMLAQLHKKVTSQQVTIIRRDALDFLATSSAQYDTIVLNNVLYTITDRDKLWRSITNRLAPGGRVIIANPDTGSSQVLLRNHIEHQSFWSLFRPSLMAVWLFDAVISASGKTKKYDFTNESEVVEQLEKGGLVVDGRIGRCYGGHKRGIDILFCAKKAQE